MVADDRPGDLDSEIRPTGSRNYWQRDMDVDLLQRRFPGHCPHHLLHNLLNLHYTAGTICARWPPSPMKSAGTALMRGQS